MPAAAGVHNGAFRGPHGPVDAQLAAGKTWPDTSALNLNIHFHLLVLDGVYVRGPDQLEFRRVAPPTKAELEDLLKTITARVGRQLQRRGWLTRDAETSHLDLDREDTALDGLLGHSLTYRIALGPRAGQKAFTLRSLPGPRSPPGGCRSPLRVRCATR